MDKKNISCVCDVLNKKCSGPYDFYILTEGTVGVEINGPNDPETFDSDIQLDLTAIIKKFIKCSVISDDWLVCKVIPPYEGFDFDLSEISIEKKKFKQSGHYADSVVFVLKMERAIDYLEKVKKILAFSLYTKIIEDGKDIKEII